MKKLTENLAKTITISADKSEYGPSVFSNGILAEQNRLLDIHKEYSTFSPEKFSDMAAKYAETATIIEKTPAMVLLSADTEEELDQAVEKFKDLGYKLSIYSKCFNHETKQWMCLVFSPVNAETEFGISTLLFAK